MSDGTQLVRYDAMCQAIAAAHAVDEVKEIRDQAMAVEAYGRQARNTELEQKACEIRLRAERRCGQLISEREMAKGGQPKNPSHAASTSPKPLADLGISHTQSSRWQKLAAIPEDDFEATFAKPGKKTTAGLLASHQLETLSPIIDAEPERRRPVDPRALWLWGRLLDFEREGILSADPNELIGSMLDHMREATFELVPVVTAWLGRIRI